MVEQVDDVLDSAIASSLRVRRDELQDIELQLFLDALVRFGGYDYREYNQAVLRRRIADMMRTENIATISGLQDRLLHDERALASFVLSLSGSTYDLFHTPGFFKMFALHVVPLLQTYSFVRIWMPGIGNGADAYSLAAILEEAGLLERAVIYATSINDLGSAVAKIGRFPHRSSSDFIAMCRQSGIVTPIDQYFHVTDSYASPTDRLRENIMFARHNPIEDGPINEFHAVVARGIFPLFNGAVQYRLHRLVFDSIMRLGFLGLGSTESLANTVHERAFRQVVPDQPIFRRMR